MTQPTKYVLLIVLYLLVSISFILFIDQDFTLPALILLTGLFITIIFLLGIRFLSQKTEKKSLEISNEISASYHQVESLFSIYSALEIDNILPPFRGWAISPDFAALILSKMKEKNPEYVLECGSGISTILIAYFMKNNKRGHLYSFEHNKQYAKATQKRLKKHGLEKYATILDTELIDHTINDNSWKWYDAKQLKQDLKFDLVMIDGPPYQLQEKARYPALPLLDNYLNPGAVILVDDCSREQDNEVINDWISEFENYDSQWFQTEKGAYILTKKV
ncbi:MAG: class I SAM-dependent methyltransferase [Bacteroidales bacterium]|nr:class I SAM-dependent methyltransferase [Bacteroidales bacterium]MCF8405335.1 class I SAM-dependent methyltransferase [Bacteroidales bacterium]